jgi:hypothetical protein
MAELFQNMLNFLQNYLGIIAYNKVMKIIDVSEEITASSLESSRKNETSFSKML